MGIALVKIKIMPESPDSDLNTIKEKAKQIALENQAQNPSTEIEPIAFGLNAIILNFSLDESLSIDDIQNKLKEIPEVVSAEVIDFRRAFG